MKELIIGQIPENFNPDLHIPLGVYCFLGKEHVYSDFETLVFDCIIKNKEEFELYDELTANEAKALVNQFAKKYYPNEFDRYSLKFWQTLFYPTIGRLVPYIYTIQQLVDIKVNKHKSESLKINIRKNNLENTFVDYSDLINNLKSINLYEFIAGKIIEKICPENWSITHIDLPYKKMGEKKKTDNKLSRDFFNQSIFKINRLKYKFINCSFLRYKPDYGFNIFDLLIFNLLCYIKPKVKKNYLVEPVISEKPYIDWKINIMDIIEILIPENLKNLSLYNRSKTKGKLYSFSNMLYGKLELQLQAAYAKENENIVIATQHGGYAYGMHLDLKYTQNVEYENDFFVTWGWNKHKGVNQKKFIQSQSPLLSKLLNKHKELNNKIILTGTLVDIYQSYGFTINSQNNYINYRLKKLELITSLFNYNIQNQLFYRPYLSAIHLGTTYLRDKEYYQEKFPELNILEQDFREELLRCRLLVLDHPGTTWNIAMAMNTPLILFWNKELFPFNDEAEYYLKRFEALGLFFECPIKTAQRVKEINDMESVSDWWNQKDIQDLRKEWMHKYARADKNWRWKYIKTLYHLKNTEHQTTNKKNDSLIK
jgi:putative transferase (TIGR04331 family)